MPSSSLDLGNLPDAGAQLVAAAAAAAAGADDQGGGVVIEGMSIPVSIQEEPPGMPTLPAIGTLPTIPAIGAASWPCRGMPGGGACVPISNETVYTSFPMPFEISNVREKNASGALLCLVVGCNKNAQGRSTTAAKAKTDAAAEEGGGEANPNPPRFHGGGGFCRYHHNLYLIQTGQVESWDCTCGQSVLAESDRCGKCHRWKGGVKRTGLGRPAGSTPVTKKAKTSDMTATLASVLEGGVEGVTTMPTLASDPTDIQISNIREVNAKGRSLCKVVGCDKLDQAKNDGFCRKHYRLLVGNPDDAGKDDSANLDPADMENWNCPCGQLISYQQKRCGKCSKVCTLFIFTFMIPRVGTFSHPHSSFFFVLYSGREELASHTRRIGWRRKLNCSCQPTMKKSRTVRQVGRVSAVALCPRTRHVVVNVTTGVGGSVREVGH